MRVFQFSGPHEFAGIVSYMYRPLLICFLMLFGLVSNVSSVEKLAYDSRRDPRFLPFEFTPVNVQPPVLTTFKVARPIHVYRPAYSGRYEKLAFTRAFNTIRLLDQPGSVAVGDYPALRTVNDNPVWLTICDAIVTRNRSGTPTGIALGGFQHDSAFVIVVHPPGKLRDTVFLNTGKDRTGNGTWNPQVSMLGQMDYDYDGTPELFVHLNPVRDLAPRELFCLDLERKSVDWSLMVACNVGIGQLVSCRDSLDPGILFVSYNPSQGTRDSNFDDSFAYFTRVNQHGRVVFNYVTNNAFGAASIVPAREDSLFYLAHAMPLTDPARAGDSIYPGAHLSLVTARGKIVKSIELATPIGWLLDFPYRNDGHQYIYGLTNDKRLFVYDSALTLLAESEKPTTAGLIGALPSWGNAGPVLLVAREDASISVVTPQLKELARISGQYDYVEPLEYDEAGNVRSVVVGGGNSWALLTDISRRSFGDYVGVVYLDYQNYILAGFSAALAALVVVNIYRRRTKRNLQTISVQKAEIEDAHLALQEAQAAIIAQEKYRQAKDIAGGFAHEIRNALFPAEASLQRLNSLGGKVGGDSVAEDKYARAASEAVTRAIRITQLISLYTKLDSEYLPERVEVARVVGEVIQSNRERVQDMGFALEVNGPEGLWVECNAQQLYMVVNNFVLNSLDALTGRVEPRILVSWKADLGRLTLTCEDNGPGIADADLPKVFDAFFSTKPSSGTGLGLAICKKIVELYDGTISATERPGGGARFTVTLKLIS